MAGPASTVTDLWRTGRLRRPLVVLLGADAVLAWVVLLGLYTFVERLWRELGGRPIGIGSLEGHLAQLETARRLQGLTWLATAALFLAWIRGMRHNLAGLGAHGLRFSERWAVAAFLVPVVNVLWGYQVVAEVWNASDPADRGGDAWRELGPPVLVGWWWTALLVASVADPGPLRLIEDLRTRLGVGGPMLLLAVGQLAEIGAAVLGLLVVRGLAGRQADKLDAGLAP